MSLKTDWAFDDYITELQVTLIQAEYDEDLSQSEKDVLAAIRLQVIELAEGFNNPRPFSTGTLARTAYATLEEPA